MKRPIFGLATLFFLGASVSVASAATFDATGVTIPGTSNPYLSGQPDGTTASSGDVAPDESPVLLSGVPIASGNVIRFPQVSGAVSRGAGSGPGPEGASIFTHFPGAQNGFSDITAPIESLLGVFVGDALPDPAAPPAALDFGSVEARNFASLSPAVAQIFFIGDGRTDADDVQDFVVPDGASRLFLGVMDGFGWYNNTGAFTLSAQVSTETDPAPNVVPLPGAAFLLIAAMGGLGALRARRG